MPRERDDAPLRPDDVTEGRVTDAEARRERRLERGEFVTHAYTPGEAVDALPAKRETGDALGERGAFIADLARVPGVGPSTAADLVRLGIRNVHDLARASTTRLADALFVDAHVAERWVNAARDEARADDASR